MIMTSIDSSHITGAGYDSSKKVMEVSFKNGSTYRYTNVPELVYEGLISAGSAGSYLAKNVKGVFSYTQV